jgi:hypothetical protein
METLHRHVDLREVGEYVYPVAVCEICKQLIEGEPYIIYGGGVVVLRFRHFHKLSYLFLQKKGRERTYKVEAEGASPALLNILRWAGELWLMPSIDVRRDVSDVCLYIRQRLGEI